MTLLETERRGEKEQGLEARFVWTGDRFGHVISVIQGRDRFPLVSTIDGDVQSEWPASPPFQQVAIEPRETGSVALLVGMAGKSHWSGSIESPPGDTRLSFDIACLAKLAPVRLGSSYRIEADHHSVEDAIVFDTPAGHVCLSVADNDRTPPTLTVAERSATICISADQGGFVPQTLRWQYDLTLIGS